MNTNKLGRATLLVISMFLSGCWTVPPTRDVDRAREDMQGLKNSLIKQGYSDGDAEVASRGYDAKYSDSRAGFSSELTRQRCVGSDPRPGEKSVTVPKCDLDYINKVKLTLLCPLPGMAPLPNGADRLTGMPARSKKVRWELEKESGETVSDGDGTIRFRYAASRHDYPVLSGEAPKSDPQPPSSMKLSGPGFDLTIPLDASAKTNIVLPDSACGGSAPDRRR